MSEKTKIAVLVSGGGTNLQALIDAQQSGALGSGEIVLVISNKKSAYALERARKAGIETAVVLRREYGDAFDDRLLEILQEKKIELIIMAGFLSILSEKFTRAYPRRIINIHPSLIPSFCGKGYYGLRVHEEALNYGVKVTGATVHFVNEIPDGGEIILQKAVAIEPGDTPEILQERVMREAEWILLPKAAEIVSKEIMEIKEARKNMDIYRINTPEELIKGNSYVGRGIVVGKTKNGKKAAAAYFIMGRSENSRNRVFVEKDGEVFTQPYDLAKVKDPSLIIYAAIRCYENNLIVTNGNQTDTIYDFLKEGKTFSQALETREFEPDAPNLTPRISAVLHFDHGDFSYEMSILKAADAAGSACNRYTFSYHPLPGLGHFLHTYVCDGNPIPSFQGEPERMTVDDEIDTFTSRLWDSLDPDNKISLYVRYTDLETGETENRLVNKNV